MSDGESFDNHPKSLAEVRSMKSQNGADWKPRDALIDMLRRIDAGEIAPDALVIGHCQFKGKTTQVCFNAASPDIVTTLGLLEAVKAKIWEARA